MSSGITASRSFTFLYPILILFPSGILNEFSFCFIFHTTKQLKLISTTYFFNPIRPLEDLTFSFLVFVFSTDEVFISILVLSVNDDTKLWYRQTEEVQVQSLGKQIFFPFVWLTRTCYNFSVRKFLIHYQLTQLNVCYDSMVTPVNGF